jgi:hypothetical protein
MDYEFLEADGKNYLQLTNGIGIKLEIIAAEESDLSKHMDKNKFSRLRFRLEDIETVRRTVVDSNKRPLYATTDAFLENHVGRVFEESESMPALGPDNREIGQYRDLYYKKY